MKTCIECKESKEQSAFGVDNARKDKLTSKCLDCRRRSARERNKINPEARRAREKRYAEKYPDKIKVKIKKATVKYKGLTLSQYQIMYDRQQGRCAWCGRHERELTKSLCIDHDHNCCPGDKSCGKCVRRLLCVDCNLVEGQLLKIWPEGLEALEELAFYKLVV